MARSNRSRKIKGGVWYDPRTWGKTTEDPLKNATPVVTEPVSNNISPETPEKKVDALPVDAKPESKTVYEMLGFTKKEGPEEIDQKTGKPVKKGPFGLWGGKSRKSKKNKGGKTKKARK